MTDVNFADLERMVGRQLGTSSWLRVDQERINAFAVATGDDQWIHVDESRAQASPFGTTIAHGYLTLSLIPVLMREVWSVTGTRMAVNYGLNRCRFPSPLPAGASVRATATVSEVSLEKDGSKSVVLEVTLEREGEKKPVCVVQTLSRQYPDEES